MSDQVEMTTSAGETPAATASSEKAGTVEELRAEMERMQKALKDANREAAARRVRLDELEAAEKERKESQMSELEKATARMKELEAELIAGKRREMQREMASKYKLPDALATRLQGATPEEIEADAKALADSLPKAAVVNPTNPGQATGSETDAQIRARIFGTNVDIFSPKTARELGGGVFFKE